LLMLRNDLHAAHENSNMLLKAMNMKTNCAAEPPGGK